jgi:hypothetical protein
MSIPPVERAARRLRGETRAGAEGRFSRSSAKKIEISRTRGAFHCWANHTVGDGTLAPLPA